MGISSFGTLLKRGDGATPTEVFATIAEVLDISGPGEELRTEESTNHSSVDGAVERTATLLDSGEITYDVNLDPSGVTHTNLRTDMRNRTLRNFQQIFPDTANTQVDFAAYVTKFQPSAPVEGVLKASITLSISGPTTWT
ncbi:MAG: outer capsid protein Hoc [Chloroflexi bacterium]|nr:MAG: outer capsid protein Hoc [Chloroflexota bacterium]MBL1196914.1 outer capsid protein Hoc [Chloroflexota bacterium]NOH14210.1 outer capsid protein Hoc [Chloroflexota bacterium]